MGNEEVPSNHSPFSVPLPFKGRKEKRDKKQSRGREGTARQEK
jgi:hypothetical protein